MAQAFPGERTRIERGLAVAQLRRILPTATVGRYLVECGDLRGGAGVPLYYEATSLACCCPDAQHHPDRRCKHSFAIEILATASAIAAREHADQDATILDLDPNEPIPYELTEQAEFALGLRTGEAACPHCGRVRGVVYDGERTRCFGCHRHWIPELPASVA
jgi:hypothetical protein